MRSARSTQPRSRPAAARIALSKLPASELRAGSCEKNLESVYFTQTDPIGLAGGVNLYGYAAGDPVNKGDPFGLCADCDDDLGDDWDSEGWGFDEFAACYSANRWSSLFDGTRFDKAAEWIEDGTMFSLAGDAYAYAKKNRRQFWRAMGGREYASGINMGLKKAGLNRARVIGNVLTPALAVPGAFISGYNMAIAAQCLDGDI